MMGSVAGNQDSSSIFLSFAPSSKKEERKHILPKYHDDEDAVLDEEETTSFLPGECNGDTEKQNGKKKEVQASAFTNDGQPTWLFLVLVSCVTFLCGLIVLPCALPALRRFANQRYEGDASVFGHVFYRREGRFWDYIRKL
jgi:hypothetical protein